ncbi:ABC transporter permease subunit [Domibacillus sp. DTU_2020_1001157_1_SI_ALB_TIR_016]|uniref:ABC transporter permease subunit n=1 Tax=Domibacillus sp. DTU_2020_1001157_1_SI_ALB_TIR_016 TaxID=3077789 RepID=UPI0028E7B600|nr:ABC transporter permease subunit [Domibacillus sp. DTU_2020_1001157_1_SI_ALB_TIR_016]WNS79162.1 ABC transporter permease subunit [Domibacillus sp. DTU_2020_1001157_1_SI_ALB_TIR_016]
MGVISYNKTIAPWLLPFLLILFWQILSLAGVISPDTLPAPSAIVTSAWQLIESGELFKHIQVSFSRAFTGFLIGGSIGLILGVANGVSPIAKQHLDTTIQMFRNIPHLALIPLVILWLGIGEEAKVFLVAIGVFFPIYVNTYYGIISVDKSLIEMGKVYGLSKRKLMLRVIFKGALPSILVGVRYSLGIMWLTLIVAETVAADAGIGYMAMNAREFMQIDIVVVAILLYAVLGKLADFSAKLLESRLLRWNPSYNKQ